MSEEKTVLVTGATGNTGSELISSLSGTKVHPIAAITSHERANALPAGLPYRICQLDNAGSLQDSCKAVDYLFICIPFHRNMIARGMNLVDAAKHEGIKHIVKVSGWHASPESRSAMGKLHGQIDQYIIDSGVDYTILRCNSFMENYSGLYASMIRKGKHLMLAEGTASFAFITTTDIAAVAAAVLLHPGQHRNKIYDLTGYASHSHSEAMAILSQVLKENIQYKPIPGTVASETYRRLGLDEWEIKILESLSNYLGEGHAAQPTDTVEKILGRKPVSLEEFFQAKRRAWLTDPGSG